MSVLDGGWNERPGMMTITIPLPDELFVEGREPQVIADFLSGTAARLAAAQYMKIAAEIEKKRTEGQIAQVERQSRLIDVAGTPDPKHSLASDGDE